MAVGLKPPVDLLPVAGVRLGVAAADIRGNGAKRNDVCVIVLPARARSAVVLTNNVFAAAPVQLIRKHRGECAAPRALLINSGNANAGTGDVGLADAALCCQQLADQLGVEAQAVWPFSTGVIGQRLPAQRLCEAIPGAVAAAAADGWQSAAQAIMTTDTVAKGCSATMTVGGQQYTVSGMTKGAGMIRPDMATMLAFVATDAPLSQAAVDSLLEHAVDASFHNIVVDGDTSTNDACTLTATGEADALIEPGTAEFAVVEQVVTQVFVDLAQRIVRDGEGATKFVTVQVDGARTADEARQVAMTVAESPLVKTAWFASDANWGRMLAAVGRSGIDGLALRGVILGLTSADGSLQTTMVASGQPADGYDESVADIIMALPEFTVQIGLGRGDATARIWTCDLGHDYVRINAEYRT
ncbi:bifunctional glutamate N-acetyltransferase/amino-acid acetyltransferase ArgJ [bacterium]|nr:bifunctional glutamate N-acetyltransferase/amino-acid acetyltransferase ArgJ [bacterium]